MSTIPCPFTSDPVTAETFGLFYKLYYKRIHRPSGRETEGTAFYQQQGQGQKLLNYWNGSGQGDWLYEMVSDGRSYPTRQVLLENAQSGAFCAACGHLL